MERLTTIAAVRRWRERAGAVGFVPTMGALHDGHLELVRRSRSADESVLVSIFVNPLQFGPNEDFERYPRDLDGDCARLAAAGVDAVFFPTVEEMYPAGFGTHVEVSGPLTERLEAASRPGHFRGVTTVVAKLLLIAQATRAYFGMKDAQQLLVVSRMVRDLAIPTAIAPVPIVREADGLAMSSRNVYLTPELRAAAAAIPRALQAGADAYGGGERSAEAIRGAVEAVLAREPVLQAEYVSCARIDTLEEWERVAGPALLSLAVRAGETRLIDNRWLGVAGEVPDVG
jgi:pantoate--beta-alanine ligase